MKGIFFCFLFCLSFMFVNMILSKSRGGFPVSTRSPGAHASHKRLTKTTSKELNRTTRSCIIPGKMLHSTNQLNYETESHLFFNSLSLNNLLKSYKVIRQTWFCSNRKRQELKIDLCCL